MNEMSVSIGYCSSGIYNHPQLNSNIASGMIGWKTADSWRLSQRWTEWVIGKGGTVRWGIFYPPPQIFRTIPADGMKGIKFLFLISIS